MRNSLTAIAPSVASRLHARRLAYQQRQLLARELAAFTTPSQRLELDEMIARHTDEEARLVKQLLRQQDVTRLLHHSR